METVFKFLVVALLMGLAALGITFAWHSVLFALVSAEMISASIPVVRPWLLALVLLLGFLGTLIVLRELAWWAMAMWVKDPDVRMKLHLASSRVRATRKYGPFVVPAPEGLSPETMQKLRENGPLPPPLPPYALKPTESQFNMSGKDIIGAGNGSDWKAGPVKPTVPVTSQPDAPVRDVLTIKETASITPVDAAPSAPVEAIAAIKEALAPVITKPAPLNQPTYVHDKCGAATIVGEDIAKLILDKALASVMCSKCGHVVPVQELRWFGTTQRLG